MRHNAHPLCNNCFDIDTWLNNIKLAVKINLPYVCNKNQQNAHFFLQYFNLIIVSSTCFEHPSVHPKEDLYMQFYGISSCVLISSLVDGRMYYSVFSLVLYNFSFMFLYININISWRRPDCLYGRMKKYHKTACTSLSEDEHLDVRNMSKTI